MVSDKAEHRDCRDIQCLVDLLLDTLVFCVFSISNLMFSTENRKVAVRCSQIDMYW